jgi:hypothetical protein
MTDLSFTPAEQKYYEQQKEKHRLYMRKYRPKYLLKKKQLKKAKQN